MSSLISRREAIRGGAAMLALLGSRKGFTFAYRQQKIGVSLDAEIGAVSPLLHGHFAEHLGSCTYQGLWVGKDSPIPNIDGYRRQAVEYLKAVGIPVLRWPGGCFADDYHWRDGIGPLQQRPKRVNIHWGNYTEDNSFGTHEFLGLCRHIGAAPYLAGNVGSGTPQELRDWLEYCNYPSGSTLSDERSANGSPEPFDVRYWGVGNENWGCGGRMTPQEYAGHYRRFATYLRGFGEVRPYLIACGPSGDDYDWTKGFLSTLFSRGQRARIDAFAMHFYSRGANYATEFTVENLQKQLSSFAQLEKIITEQRTLMDEFDPDRRIGLLVDEWGVWDRMVPEEQERYGRLWQQNTMRCALAAAMGMNVFHRQADKLAMCNIAQTVNVLQALLLAYENNCIRTPTYYAYELAAPHRGKTAVQVELEDASPLGLSVSASRQGPELVLTCANPNHESGLSMIASVSGGKPVSATARLLHHEDFNACNTFENPGVVVPRDHDAGVQGSQIQLELPPLSVVTANIRLA